MRYRGGEIDDGAVAVGSPYEADIDRWANGEAINDRDVVIWYGGHFTHDVDHAAWAHRRAGFEAGELVARYGSETWLTPYGLIGGTQQLQWATELTGSNHCMESSRVSLV